MIDTTILRDNILLSARNRQVPLENLKFEYWSSVVDLRNHAFKNRNGMEFTGFIRTDGVSISVLLERPGFHRPQQRTHNVAEQIPYFQDHINSLKNNLVFIDPNRRDLLFCLGSNDQKLRYTSMQRRRESKQKEHVKIRNRIYAREGLLEFGVGIPLPSRKTVNPEFFNAYLLHFFRHINENEHIYGNEQFRKLKFAK
jgi:hypothetical protein